MDTASCGRLQCCAKIGDVLLIGEQLRIQMHTDNPHLIKDRRHHFRSFQCCFVGKETIKWLLNTGKAPDRDTAIYLMNILISNNVLHQVNDECMFKDENIMYRFRKDDGTFPWHEDVAVFLRAQRIFNKLRSSRISIMGSKEVDGVTYRNTLTGSDFVDWLINNKEMNTREEAVKECRRFLENDIIRHVTDGHHFKDSNLLYQFKMDFSHELELMDLILPPHDAADNACDGILGAKTDSCSVNTNCKPPKTSSTSNSLSIPGSNRQAERSESGYHSDRGSSSDVEVSPAAVSPSNMSLENTSNKMRNMQITNQSTLLHRIATAEELEALNAPYVRKYIRIMSDPVGFGFVIRGNGPVYVKTVDPTGPAAQAGLKVGHYIYMVNDEVALHMNHKDLAHWILASSYLRLCVLEHI